MAFFRLPQLQTASLFTTPFLIAASLVGCGGSSGSDDDPEEVGTDRGIVVIDASVDAGTTWQWQLQGTLNTGYDVTLYDIDLFDTFASQIAELQQQGRLVICYFSGGSYEEWRDDAGDFPEAVLGNNLDGWEGERWLDIRADSVRDIMAVRLGIAADKGCDGVEPDNMDGYLNDPGFDLTYDDQLSYNRFIADAAHEVGLLVGLKNDLDQIEDLVTYFDFAVNEECWEYQECDMTLPFIEAGKAVLHAEYSDALQDSATRAEFCDDMNALGLSSLYLPLDLDDSFRFSCQE